MVDKTAIMAELQQKWSIKSHLATKMADILIWMADKGEIRTEEVVAHFGLSETTAKRYMRQLTDMGYIQQLGANRNRRYMQHER